MITIQLHGGAHDGRYINVTQELYARGRLYIPIAPNVISLERPEPFAELTMARHLCYVRRPGTFMTSGEQWVHEA